MFIMLTCSATHNRAGEITYTQISAYTFEITIVTFTNTKPTSDGVIPVKRGELTVLWGDNTYSVVPLEVFYVLPDYYNKNIYRTQHTFPGPGTFEIVVEDPNRNEGVENIPNSIAVVFSIKTILQINPLLGFNNTPILLNPPVDKGAVHRKFIHNPAAYDPDGDSISYQLTVCTGENGEPIANYQLPESSNKPININEITGDLVWDSPVKAGIYNVAFFIEEWRQGVKIGQITRDMQIEVYNTDNTPPIIDSVHPICVIAGDSLTMNVTAKDSADEIITLTATGGVFEVDSAAIFISEPSKGSVTGVLAWNTECFHVRKNPYKVVFKATDNNADVNLVDQIATEISVLGPPVENIVTNASNNAIVLTWDEYHCKQAKAFNIYRSINYYDFNAEECEIGVPPYTGYKKIATIDDISAMQFLDNNNGLGLNQGFEYCYMITAEFTDGVEGIASQEVCAQLERGTPIITNVSVTNHDANVGEIYLAWSKPIEFDTLLFPGPHKYIIKRSNDIWGANFIVIDSLNSLNDTIYYDNKINTLTQAYSYKIEIHNEKGLTEQPMIASSVYPELFGSGNTIKMQIISNTPWINNQYVIYRQNSETNNFDSIGTSATSVFIDNELVNNEEYCYQVKSIGGYNLSGILNPIVNKSHRNCGVPIDTIPPEPVVLAVKTDCKIFVNTLSWVPNSNDNDIAKYYIYYTQDINSNYIVIDSVLGADTLNYQHVLLDFPSGCYAVTAIDSNNNESRFSNIVCVDMCNYYELPNVFTPNNDNINDFYIPLTPTYIIDRFILRVDFKVYSRWGNLVFETNDIHLNWNGNHYKTDRLVTPGVYYYICDLSEKRISGEEERNIVGFIHVFHNNESIQQE